MRWLKKGRTCASLCIMRAELWHGTVRAWGRGNVVVGSKRQSVVLVCGVCVLNL